MTRVRFLVPLIAVLASSLASAQNAVVRWTDDWDGPASQDDFVNKVAVAPNGDVVVVGRSYDASVGFPPAPPTQDALVARWSASGVLQWARRVDRFGADDQGQDVAIDPASGDVFAVGYSSGQIGASFVTDVWLARFDAAGNTVWNIYWDGPGAGADFGRTLMLDAGGIYVGAASNGGPSGQDMVLLRFDMNGVFQWEARVNGTGNGADSGTFLCKHPSGDLILAGQLLSTAGGGDIGVARVTPTGSIVWQNQRDGSAHTTDFGLDVACDAAGDVYVAGWSTIGSDLGPTLVKWDASGVFQWAYDYPEPAAGAGQFRGVEVDGLGHVDVLGYAASVSNGLDLVTMQFDSAGNVLWERRFDGPAHKDETARTLRVDGASNLLVCGWSNGPSGSTTDADTVIARYDVDGNLRWSHVGDDATSEDRAQDVATGPGGTIAYASFHKPGTSYDVQVVTLGEQGTPFCFGDGSSGPCPCANESALGLGGGCLNSIGRAAELVDTGIASLSADTLVLNGSEMPNSSALYIQGTVAADPVPMLGDGLLCAGGTLIRIGTKPNAGNASHYPELGNASVSIRGQVTAPGSRAYQVWYRNAAPLFCTPATFNLSNGLLVTWSP